MKLHHLLTTGAVILSLAAGGALAQRREGQEAGRDPQGHGELAREVLQGRTRS